MRVLQLNLNHCEAAQDLLQQTVRDLKIDVAILCEQYKNMEGPTWFSDRSSRAAIWTYGLRQVREVITVPSTGFTGVEADGIYIYSVYAPPSLSIPEFETLLNRLVADARGRRPLIIAGDFNAWATAWGSRVTNRRGEALLDHLASLDVVLANTGNSPTFSRNGDSSIVDLTFVSECIARSGLTWVVSDQYTHSDHHAILMEMGKPEKRRTLHQPSRKWSTKKLDTKALVVMMEDVTISEGPPEEQAEELMTHVVNACDASMPRCSPSDRRPPVYWWNEEIAQLRRKCIKSRRLCQRARSRPDSERLREQHRNDRNALKKAIKASKRLCWRELCREVDEDPWGRPYKIVMTKLNGAVNMSPTCPNLLQNIVATLFPSQTETNHAVPIHRPTDVPPVSPDELRNACRRIRDTKAPGPDGIPNAALKVAIEARPDLFLGVLDRCLREGSFPRCWKRQRLVLLPKGKKPPCDPSSYRPICLLDTAGKILERIVCSRLETFVESNSGLSDNQFGFRKARSTVEAIGKVVSIAREAISGARWRRGTKKYCAVVTLDIKNAFNSARWNCILNALHLLEVPVYIRTIISDYFKDRVLLYYTDDGPRRYDVTGGVPQGSVLGPLLWNIMYDAVLRLELPHGAETIGFADDVALVVVDKHLEDVTLVANRSIAIIRRWLSLVGLVLADHKTEAVLITSRKTRETITLRVGGHKIQSGPHLRYLGVWIDARLHFDEHLRLISQKADGVISALSRIMPNTGGPRQSRRKLLATVVSSTLLYAAPIWASTLATAAYARRTISVYRRSALRVVCAYRTVSYDAVCVVAGMTPIEILADERRRIYYQGRHGSRIEALAALDEEKRETMRQWQNRWDATLNGRWTHRLIPRINEWASRVHGEVDFFVTQLLTGHGCFRAYLHRFKLDDDPTCPACPGQEEDVEHVMYNCPRFSGERDQLQEILQQRLTPENTIPLMMSTEDRWAAIATYAARVLRRLRAEERARSESH